MSTTEDNLKLTAFLLENDKEEAARKVLETVANMIDTEEVHVREAAGKPYLYLDPDLGPKLHEWHGGQDTALYAVGSQIYAGKKVMKKNLKEAIDELEDFYEVEKWHKHLKPADRHELEDLIDTLDGYLSGAIEDYSYAFEGDD